MPNLSNFSKPKVYSTPKGSRSRKGRTRAAQLRKAYRIYSLDP